MKILALLLLLVPSTCLAGGGSISSPGIPAAPGANTAAANSWTSTQTFNAGAVAGPTVAGTTITANASRFIGGWTVVASTNYAVGQSSAQFYGLGAGKDYWLIANFSYDGNELTAISFNNSFAAQYSWNITEVTSGGNAASTGSGKSQMSIIA